MGSVDRVDKTLLLNEIVYYVRKDAMLRELWKKDLAALARQFNLSTAEYEAIRDSNVRALLDMGVHQYLIPHILRLTFGATGMTNAHPALTAYQKAFPAETLAALGGTQWDSTK
jgi:hypothetical protein